MNNEIKLTDGPDDHIVASDVPEWFTLFALQGDDRIVLRSNGNVLAGAGNDVIVNETGQIWSAAVYWDSPGPIVADLQTGKVQDGWGTTDTLVGFHQIHTSGRDGDTVYGSSDTDGVWVNGFGGPGRATIDLRDGEDEVTVHGPLSAYTLKVSADGKQLEISRNGFVATLTNVERLKVWNATGKDDLYAVAVADLIDMSQLGPQVLLSDAQNNWTNGQPGQAVNLTYSFMSAPPTYGGQESGTGFATPDAAYQQAVRDILQRLQTVVGLRFTEVSDTAAQHGQLRFGANQQAATKGYTYLPGPGNDQRAGDVWMDLESLQRLAPGEEGREALLHEIGHALGLLHPTDVTSHGQTALLSRWNNNSYTLMSSQQAATDMWQSWFGALDIQALSALYGPSRDAAVVHNDFWQLQDEQGAYLWTLHDDAGSDVLDASHLSTGATLDLRPGGLSSVGLQRSGSASWNNLFTDYGTLIERIFDSPSDDVIFGNSQDNLIHWSSGNDVIDGQAGQDTLFVDALRADFNVGVSDYTQLFELHDIAGVKGHVTLQNIERIWFRDTQLTLGATSADSIEPAALANADPLLWDRTGPSLLQVGTPAPYARIAAGQALTLTMSENLVLGEGAIRLTHLGTGLQQVFSAAQGNLQVAGKQLIVGQADDLDVNATYQVEWLGQVVCDLAGNPEQPTPTSTLRVSNPDGLYQFFIVAFAAAPGAYYMEQLATAYNYGLSIATIVEIFTTKKQFTSVYPTSLSHKELATQLVANIVKKSATEAAKASAILDIETTLDMGWSIGKILYTVFGNLAKKSPDDQHWAGTAKQFANQVAVAKYLTESMEYRNDDLADLKHILADVTPMSDISSPEKMAALVGMALESLPT